jgi:uncharacterized DUF497 family protein
MRITELEWDDENINHIARHNVNPEEVEDVCFGLNLSERESHNRYILGGQTSSGRYINVVIERAGWGTFRPITAFEMDEKQKARYRKRMGK